MKLSKEEKLQKKVKNCYENQKFYSKFEDAIESVQAWFITGGIVIGGAGIASGLIPAWLLIGCLVSIFSPIISVTFSRMMQQFYNDRGEYLKEKLYALPTQEQTQTKPTKTLETQKENTKTLQQTKKENINKQNNKAKHKDQKSKDDNSLDL